MHLLIKGFPFFIFLISIISCKPQGALTPRDAFNDLKKAYERSDSKAIGKQLSRESIKKINSVTTMFSRMDDAQIKSLSKMYGIRPEKLRRLSVTDYITLNISLNRKNNAIGSAVKFRIVGIKREGYRAAVKVENGIELVFVKEGPYWKFDTNEL